MAVCLSMQALWWVIGACDHEKTQGFGEMSVLLHFKPNLFYY